jgi:hypothetical protein
MVYIKVLFEGAPVGVIALQNKDALVTLHDSAHDAGLTLEEIGEAEWAQWEEDQTTLYEFIEALDAEEPGLQFEFDFSMN